MAENAKPAAYPSPSPVEFKKVRENIYIASGGVGSNNGFVIGKECVVAIDAKMDEASSAQALKLLGEITPLPVRYMILTHGDIDHVTGLTAYPSGMTIAAHYNAALDIKRAGNPADKNYCPGVTFTETMEVNACGKKISLMHFGPAHTTGDAVIYFKEEKAAFIGDLVFIGREQIVHLARGGSVSGLIKNLDEILGLDADIFFPGHYESVTRGDIESHSSAIKEKFKTVGEYVKDGLSLEDVKKAMGVVDMAVRPGGRVFPGIVECAYLEITAFKKGR
jgi:glyoxylase-like metal-dependent hydrolase (beta-lactamase superfamily II)